MEEQLERKDAAGISSAEPVKTEGPLPNSPGTSERSDGVSSPPPNCSICLGKLINTSFTDSCLHQFCFTCLLQWSKIKTECPLCKQTFKSIIHNVRSEEDYDQYHVPRELASQLPSSQVAATLDVNFELFDGVTDVGVRRFVYRTTMTPNRRFGVLLNPEQVARRVQIPNIMAPTVSREERRNRRLNPTEYRRNVYRSGEWSNLLPDVYGRFRECSAEYYRRHPNELNRLIPWINRELQTLLNANEPHIAYVLRVVMDALTRYDMRGAEFRDMVRPYFGQFTNHFVHELLNYARTSFDLVGYDQYVTYPTRGLGVSNEYVTRVVSPNSSSSSTSSDDSDVRVVDQTIDVNRIFTELLSAGSHIVDMPGPSTVGETFHVPPTTSRGPDVLTISSSPSSSEECTVVGYVKPRHERTPEVIELLSSGGGSPSSNRDVTSRTPVHDIEDRERPGPSHEDHRRSNHECCNQKSNFQHSRHRWSTSSSSSTNDEADKEYLINRRQKSPKDDETRPQTREHSRNTRSRTLTKRTNDSRSPNNVNQRRTSTSGVSVEGNDRQSVRRKIRDRTQTLRQSFIISDSESSDDDRNKWRKKKSGKSNDSLTSRARKRSRKSSRKLEESTSSSRDTSVSDESVHSKNRERKRGRSRRNISSSDPTSSSTETLQNTSSDKSNNSQPVLATILRKNTRKPDEWYVKKKSSREISSSSTSSSEPDIGSRKHKKRRNSGTNGNRCGTVSDRTRAKDHSRRKDSQKKEKIRDVSSDTFDSADSKRTRREYEGKKSRESTGRKNDGKKSEHSRKDRKKSIERTTTSNNRRRKENEESYRDDYVRRRDKNNFDQDNKNNRKNRESSRTRKYEGDNKKNYYSKKQDDNNDNETSKSCGKKKDYSQRCDDSLPKSSRHSQNEKDSPGRDKHKRKKKLKRRRSRSESKSQSRKTKYRMARSSSYTAPDSKYCG